ncbi:DivIVA domain-containing protein [Blastococcus sp. LR1]|uniref:DivIVA domain-containing protein n=1 Tax=Blastococcus sp. LR1 TaxID=2877000 RepID=UPI001CCB9C77|nr:DivIVA domain-containing protein [Blastococcus sp. LR1]MCA0144391.1 DivIVA domain-containing protein [Blastococcus sp. LR1]
MLSFLVFVLAVLLVGGVLFLVGSLLLGRGETQPPADTGRSPVALPDDRAVTAADVRALQITVTARGYRMTEVDWLLDRFARTLEDRDAEIAGLRAELAARAEQETPTDPGAAPVEAARPVEGGVHRDA